MMNDPGMRPATGDRGQPPVAFVPTNSFGLTSALATLPPPAIFLLMMLATMSGSDSTVPTLQVELMVAVLQHQMTALQGLLHSHGQVSQWGGLDDVVENAFAHALHGGFGVLGGGDK